VDYIKELKAVFPEYEITKGEGSVQITYQSLENREIIFGIFIYTYDDTENENYINAEFIDEDFEFLNQREYEEYCVRMSKILFWTKGWYERKDRLKMLLGGCEYIIADQDYISDLELYEEKCQPQYSAEVVGRIKSILTGFKKEENSPNQNLPHRHHRLALRAVEGSEIMALIDKHSPYPLKDVEEPTGKNRWMYLISFEMGEDENYESDFVKYLVLGLGEEEFGTSMYVTRKK
jgi:hypothetical protein